MTSYSEAIDARDFSNLQAVRDLFAHADPVPADLTERMKFAISVQTLHAEVAELMDTALLSTRGASGGEREAAATESVTFTAASVSLMVTVTTDPQTGLLTIDGYLTAPAARVEAVTAEETRSVNPDASGRFVLHHLDHGPVHFVIVTEPDNPAVRPVITPTIQI